METTSAPQSTPFSTASSPEDLARRAVEVAFATAFEIIANAPDRQRAVRLLTEVSLAEVMVAARAGVIPAWSAETAAALAAPFPFLGGAWRRVELMGHAQAVGLVTEVMEFGATWMRVVTVCPGGHVVREKSFNPRAAVYATSPIEEAEARKLALAECDHPDHPRWCRGCGLLWIAGANTCDACGNTGRSKYAPDPTDPERDELPQRFLYVDIVNRAGAEAAPRTQVGHEEPDTPSATFASLLTRDEKLAAVAWAMTWHRKRRGEAVEVPERPAFLRDRDPNAPVEDAPINF